MRIFLQKLSIALGMKFRIFTKAYLESPEFSRTERKEGEVKQFWKSINK